MTCAFEEGVRESYVEIVGDLLSGSSSKRVPKNPKPETKKDGAVSFPKQP